MARNERALPAPAHTGAAEKANGRKALARAAGARGTAAASGMHVAPWVAMKHAAPPSPSPSVPAAAWAPPDFAGAWPEVEEISSDSMPLQGESDFERWNRLTDSYARMCARAMAYRRVPAARMNRVAADLEVLAARFQVDTPLPWPSLSAARRPLAPKPAAALRWRAGLQRLAAWWHALGAAAAPAHPAPGRRQHLSG